MSEALANVLITVVAVIGIVVICHIFIKAMISITKHISRDE